MNSDHSSSGKNKESAGEPSPRASTPQAPSLYEPQDAGLELGGEKNTVGYSGEQPLNSVPAVIGGFRLLERLGQGGAGTVYRAESVVDQLIVAVKVLRPEVMANAKAVRRFEKEARLLAEVESPFVTRLVDFGRDGQRHYIVSEFVDGIDLRRVSPLLREADPRITLKIFRDVLKALDAMHSRGLVHRDVKPENVLLIFEGLNASNQVEPDRFQQAKLTDFGLARHIEQSESLAMTQQKAILGTPLYLAPEQYSESRRVDARADIYSLGASIYHMLAGAPPFDEEDFLKLAERHRIERPRPLNRVRPEISDALSNAVAKALEKQPEMRYADASAMLADLENLLAGRPISLRFHPTTPATGGVEVRRFDFSWELDAKAEDLWPLVADTDRFNRAMGLPAPEFVLQPEPHEVGMSPKHNSSSPTPLPSAGHRNRKFRASVRFNGMSVNWTEHPFEWIEGRELSVLREFDAGPFEWVTSTVELFPLIDGRTRVEHRFQVKPVGLLGRLFTPIQFNWLTRRSLNRIYPRIAEIARGCSNPLVCDLPFGKPAKITAPQKLRLEELVTQLDSSGIPGPTVNMLANYLETAADASVSRIRPKPLARSFACPESDFLKLCLEATHIGLLSMIWDLICPVCRVAAGTKDSIKSIANHGYCEVCQTKFEVDFASTVELVFRVHPQIRETDTRTYCIGGPFHAPHVIAQNRLQPGDRVDIAVRLGPGTYEVRGPQFPQNQEFTVSADSLCTFCRLDLLVPIPRPELAAGPVCLELHNPGDQELLARLERKIARYDATTAAEVSQNSKFQNLFPGEVISAEQLYNLTHAHVLFVRLFALEELIEQLGEVKVRALCLSQIKFLQKQQLVNSIDSKNDRLQIICDTKQAAFDSLLNCYRWLAAQSSEAQSLEMGFAICGGEVLVGGTQSEYFGKLVRDGHRLSQYSSSDTLTALASYCQDEEFRRFAEANLLPSEDRPGKIAQQTIRKFVIARKS